MKKEVFEPLEIINLYLEKYKDNKKKYLKLLMLKELKEEIVSEPDEFADRYDLNLNTTRNWYYIYKRFGLLPYIGELPLVKVSANPEKEGLKCLACGIYFERKKSKPTVCDSCLRWAYYVVLRGGKLKASIKKYILTEKPALFQNIMQLLEK